MAAGAGYIEFSTGDILTASAANSYLASQVVMVFADASARTSAITSPQEGMVSYLKDTNAIEYYSGSGWVAVGGSSSGPAFSAYLSANQSVTGSTWTKITFDTETFDTDSCFASNRFTPTKAGYYQINMSVSCQSNFNIQAQGAIYKNGSAYLVSSIAQADQGIGTKDVSAVIYMNGSTDYVEGYGNIDAGGGPRFNGGSTVTQFSGVWIRG